MRLWLFVVALACAAPVFGSGLAGTETLRGTIVQKEKGAITLVASAGGRTRRITVVADKDGETVLRDKHLAKLEVALHGHFTSKSRFEPDPFFDKPIHAVKDGRELLVTYWCGNCGIRCNTPGKCICCGGDTDLQLHEDEPAAGK